MKRRILSVMLAILMLICIIPVSVSGSGEGIVVYVSVSRYGELVNSSSGEPMAYVPVTLEESESYNLNDCFIALHRIYHPEGESAYVSSVGDWGLSVDKLWGDESYNFGYQVNNGNETVMGLTHQIEDGDYIDVCIYKNMYPDTEGYARFDNQNLKVSAGIEFTLTLSYVSGYDESWNSVYSPCEEADIFIDGVATEFKTDSNGEVTLSFEAAGTHVISAKKNKTLRDESVPAITAPVCLVNVLEPEVLLLHGIAKTYSESDLTAAGGNLPWIVADMAVYEELYPESVYCFSDDKKETALRLLVEFAQTAETPGDLAKTILAISSLGYDASRIFNEEFKHIDIVKKLAELVETEDDRVTNIYTLPYVIIALSQTDETFVESLLEAAITSKEQWQDTTYGTDAITPMISALAPYSSNKDEIRQIIEESVLIVKEEQREDGLIDGFPGYEAASTGLAVWALSTAGEDSAAVRLGEYSLIDGLVSVSNADLNAFDNAFATEQAFRGLLAWSLLTEKNDKTMYDFSEYNKDEINFSGANLCPVKFEISPAKADVSLDGGEIIGNNLYDLSAGEYTYEIKAAGYHKSVDTFTISDEEAENHILKTINVSLKLKSSGGSTGGGTKPSVQKEDNKEEAVAEPTTEPGTEAEAEETTPVSKIFVDVEENAWYNPAVQYVYDKGLFGGTELGFEPDRAMTRAMLVTVLFRLDGGENPATNISFGDVAKDSWFAQSVAWAVDAGIVQGVADDRFAPDEDITREQLAVIIYRYALHSNMDTSAIKELSFVDVDDISGYAEEALNYAVGAGIINGKDDNKILPKDKASRAEVATMLMRFAEVMNK